mgnify:CR=1 FL=1
MIILLLSVVISTMVFHTFYNDANWSFSDWNIYNGLKLIEFPFILIFEDAEDASEKFKSSVTKLSPDAVTFVDEETVLIAIAFEAAEELSDAPISTTFI